MAGAVRPVASIRTPTRRIDPDNAFDAASKPVRPIKISPSVKSTVMIDAAANTPVAPSRRSGSAAGMSTPPAAAVTPNVASAPLEVMSAGYLSVNVVLVSGEFDSRAPDMTKPAPTEPRSLVNACRLVAISSAEPFGKSVMLIWASDVGAIASTSIVTTSPDMILDLSCICFYEKLEVFQRVLSNPTADEALTRARQAAPPENSTRKSGSNTTCPDH